MQKPRLSGGKVRALLIEDWFEELCRLVGDIFGHNRIATQTLSFGQKDSRIFGVRRTDLLF